MPHPLDTLDMEAVIRQSPGQLADGLTAAATASLPEEAFDHVLVAGMGGSWMSAQLVQEAHLLRVPLTVHRDYDLPSLPSGKTVVIASSFSGNTEETLSAYEAAKRARCTVIGVAAGGELEKRTQRDRRSFVKIPAYPPTMQPRSATGYGVGILVQLLTRLGLTVPDAVPQLEHLRTYLASFMERARESSESLAPLLTTVTPIIYASEAFGTVARIWKIKINENAKTPAFWNVFPELNHNELIGWTAAHGPFHVLLLRSPDDHPRTQKRMEITAELLQRHGIPATLVPIEGRTRLEQIFGTLLIGDWLSYALALALGVDPSPVLMVEDLKRRLKE